MLKIIFNKSNIESIQTPFNREKIYSSEIKGLFCEVFKTETKTFRVQYKLNNLRYVYTIGQYPSIHPSYAITKAKEIKRLVSEGKNPQKEKSESRKELTYREYFLNVYLPLKISSYDDFKEVNAFIGEDKSIKNVNRIRYSEKVNKGLETLIQNYNSTLRTHSFCNKRMIDISPLDIQRLFLDIPKKQTANQLMRQLRNVFEFYNPNDNPVKIALKKFIKLHESEARQRKATDEEILLLEKKTKLILNEYQKSVLNNDIGRYQKTISKTLNGYFTVLKLNT